MYIESKGANLVRPLQLRGFRVTVPGKCWFFTLPKMCIRVIITPVTTDFDLI